VNQVPPEIFFIAATNENPLEVFSSLHQTLGIDLDLVRA
jgi:hypothetical protein